LAFNSNSELVGSVSGGCIEEDLIDWVNSGAIKDISCDVFEFGVTAEENERIGLPCGGSVKVLVQVLSRASDFSWIEKVLQSLLDRQCVERRLDLDSGNTCLEATTDFKLLEFRERALSQTFGPRMRLFLIGAGQLSQCVAAIAVAMDYEVCVIDPRVKPIEFWSGPKVELVRGMPDDILKTRTDSKSIVITLTHDPRIDDMALCEALEGPAWYVGALGSIRTTQRRMERLEELGIPKAACDRLHAPVGLSIGSKTPMEIAVAIIGEITQLRSYPNSDT